MHPRNAIKSWRQSPPLQKKIVLAAVFGRAGVGLWATLRGHTKGGWSRSFLFSRRLPVLPVSKVAFCRCNLVHRNRSDFCDLRLRCPSRTPEIARFQRQLKAMLHCDLRVRWKVASDLRFRAAIFDPKTPSFCGISGDLAPSTQKSLAIAIVRFWCAKRCKSFKILRRWATQPTVEPSQQQRTAETHQDSLEWSWGQDLI